MTLASTPTRDGAWHGEDVTIDELLAHLEPLADGQRTLLVAAGSDVADASVRAALEDAHEARTVILREHDADRIDASVVAHQRDGATLVADAGRLCHADTLLAPLLAGGPAPLLWLAGARSLPCEQPLARLATAVVLDAADTEQPRESFARASRLGAAAPVRDLAWLRLRRWRERIATAFESPRGLALLGTADHLELRFGGPDTAAPLLLAGWLTARAGWSLQRISGAAETWSGTAQRVDGGRVALTLGSLGRDDERPGIHELVLHADGDSLRLAEPLAELSLAEALATASQADDGPAPGYEAALAAIAQGLAAA